MCCSSEKRHSKLLPSLYLWIENSSLNWNLSRWNDSVVHSAPATKNKVVIWTRHRLSAIRLSYAVNYWVQYGQFSVVFWGDTALTNRYRPDGDTAAGSRATDLMMCEGRNPGIGSNTVWPSVSLWREYQTPARPEMSAGISALDDIIVLPCLGADCVECVETVWGAVGLTMW